MLSLCITSLLLSISGVTVPSEQDKISYSEFWDKLNAHEIDFDEVINRCKIYKNEERKRSENCNLIKMANKI